MTPVHPVRCTGWGWKTGILDSNGRELRTLVRDIVKTNMCCIYNIDVARHPVHVQVYRDASQTKGTP